MGWLKIKWCQRELGIPLIAHTDMVGRSFQHVPVSSSLVYDVAVATRDKQSSQLSSPSSSSPSLGALQAHHHRASPSNLPTYLP